MSQVLPKVEQASQVSLSRPMPRAELGSSASLGSRDPAGEEGLIRISVPKKEITFNPNDNLGSQLRQSSQPITSFQDLFDEEGSKISARNDPEAPRFELFACDDLGTDIWAFFQDPKIHCWRKGMILFFNLTMISEWVLVGIGLGSMFRIECQPMPWEICRTFINVLFYLGLSLLESNFALLELVGTIKYFRKVFLLVPFGLNCLGVFLLFEVLLVNDETCQLSSDVFTRDSFENCSNTFFFALLFLAIFLVSLSEIGEKLTDQVPQAE